ncbi:MAG: triose-phosphate isomerase [Patescibacteria group bacterium]
MKKLIVGNWKLYVNTPAEGKKLIRDIDKKLPRGLKVEVALCPQVSLAPLLKSEYKGKRMSFGTQDVFFEGGGAHTGQTSPKALVASGIKYVIVGHAERRAEGDTDEIVAKKAVTAIKAKLHPIVCVGEPSRDSEGVYLTYLANSVISSLARIEATDASKFTIAYDPLWAIGAPLAPSPRIVAEAVMFIRKTIADMWGRERALKVRIIYGGSVNAESAALFAATPGIQGLLPGRASVDAEEFTGIIRAFNS